LERNAAAARSLVAAAAQHGTRHNVGDESALFTGVPHDKIVDFLGYYAFDKRSSDAHSGQLIAYIGKRVATGSLGRWSVGVVGNSMATADTKRCDLGSGIDVRMVRRSRLVNSGEGATEPVADIKTLSSRRDEALDLRADRPSSMTRKELVALRKVQRPDEGLLLIYPIEPMSDTRTKGRKPLDAPTVDVVIGVAFVFPEPASKDSDVEYWSADLSDVEVEEEDLSVLELDDE
jgi:hypothetical protein